MSNTNENNLESKVRIFFRDAPWKKILTFSFFLFLAFIFWFLSIYREKFDSTLVLPIKYTNIPDSIAFDEELPSSINVRIRDDGAALVKYFFSRKMDTINVNIRELITNSKDRSIQGRAIEQLVRDHLLFTSELISYSPSRITYSFNILNQKQLPVIYNGHLSLASGYMIDGDMVMMPDSVFVYGTKTVLDTMEYAYTVSDTVTEINSSRTLIVPLLKQENVRFVPSRVKMTVEVDEFTLKEIDVPITCINIPPNMDIKFFPSSVKVPFMVGLKRFDDIDVNDFKIVVDYNEIRDLHGCVSSIQIRLTESPDFVKTKMPIPSEIEFVMELK